VVVAVLDTGVSGMARGLFLNLLGGYDFISDPCISLDENGRDENAMDQGDAGPSCPTPSWHRTKVASVLAASHDNELGIKGIASNCSVLPIRILGVCSQGYANVVTDAIVWAAGGKINGVVPNPTPAHIISMSFAGTGPCPTYLQSAISQAVGLGAKLFAAAGNQGLTSIANTFPANCINVTRVGAFTRLGTVAAYSNRGFTMAAPGGDQQNPILAASIDKFGNLVQARVMGTSIAVPHAVAVSALEKDIVTHQYVVFAKMRWKENVTSDSVYAADVPCDPGYGSFDDVTCTAIQGGYYCTGTINVVNRCGMCSKGTYSAAAASACTSCPVGFTSDYFATSIADCTVIPTCPYGQSMKTMACVPCPNGNIYASILQLISQCCKL
jgi:hypothetical protein